jgi:DNA polymerase IIIc chi subunit
LKKENNKNVEELIIMKNINQNYKNTIVNINKIVKKIKINDEENMKIKKKYKKYKKKYLKLKNESKKSNEIK